MGKGLGMLPVMMVGLEGCGWGRSKYDTSHTDAEVATAAINADIDAHLPKGSPETEGVKVLAAHGANGHYYLSLHAPQEAFHGASAIDAFTSGAFGNAVHECRLYYNFYFDEAERLTSYH
jgi:hypothetical protein